MTEDFEPGMMITLSDVFKQRYAYIDITPEFRLFIDSNITGSIADQYYDSIMGELFYRVEFNNDYVPYMYLREDEIKPFNRKKRILTRAVL